MRGASWTSVVGRVPSPRRGDNANQPAGSLHAHPARCTHLQGAVDVVVTVQQDLRLHNGHQAGVLGDGGVPGQGTHQAAGSRDVGLDRPMVSLAFNQFKASLAYTQASASPGQAVGGVTDGDGGGAGGDGHHRAPLGKAGARLVVLGTALGQAVQAGAPGQRAGGQGWMGVRWISLSGVAQGQAVQAGAPSQWHGWVGRVGSAGSGARTGSRGATADKPRRHRLAGARRRTGC